jgi:hypothetical protein
VYFVASWSMIAHAASPSSHSTTRPRMAMGEQQLPVKADYRGP